MPERDGSDPPGRGEPDWIEPIREDPPDGDRPRRDRWRPIRRTVAQTVLVFTVVFLLALLRALTGYGNGPRIDRTAGAWVVWGAGVAVMAGASVLAVLSLRAKETGPAGRLAAWCGGVWLAGFVLTMIYSSMVAPPS